MKNAIIICSGGLDSITTAHYAKKKLLYDKLKILFFDYGQRTLKKEEILAKQCAKDLKATFTKIKLSWLNAISGSMLNSKKKPDKITRKQLKNTKKESKKWYVPCRNSVFIISAMAFADSLYIKEKKKYDIFIGFKCEGNESYPDTTKEFVEKMNVLSKKTTLNKGRIIAPLINLDKEDIINQGKRLGVDFRKTFSCYVSSKNHCGKCLACMLRKEGFYWANLQDPIKYLKS